MPIMVRTLTKFLIGGGRGLIPFQDDSPANPGAFLLHRQGRSIAVCQRHSTSCENICAALYENMVGSGLTASGEVPLDNRRSSEAPCGSFASLR
jgi:hypothetical protein